MQLPPKLTELAESKGIRMDEGWRMAVGDFWAKLRGDGLAAQLIRGSGGVFVVKVAGAGLGFVSHIILARALGVGGYGTYVYVYTWMMILSQFSKFGFHNSLVRFVPEYKVNGEWGLLKGILRQSAQIMSILSGLLAVTVILAGIYCPSFMGVKRIPTFLVGALGVPFLALLGYEKGVLRGLKHVVLADLPQMTLRPAFLVFLIATVLWFSGAKSLPPATAMGMHTAALCLAFTAGLAFIYVTKPEGIQRHSQSEYDTRKWFSVTLPLLVIASMHLLSRQTSLLMIGFLGGDEVVGLFGAAMRISKLVVFGVLAANMIVAPIVAELYHDGKHTELQRLLKLGAWAIFVCTGLFSLFLVFCGPFVLQLFGETFQQAYMPLLVMLSGLIVNSMCGVVGNVMMMTGHEKCAAVIVGLAVGLNLLLCFLLVPGYGAIGGAIAMSVSMIFWNLAMVFYVLWEMELNPTIFKFPISNGKSL